MGIPLNLASVDQLVSEAREYFSLNVLSWAMAAQIAVVGLVLLFRPMASRGINVWFTRLQEQCSLAPELCAELPVLMTFKRVIHTFLPFIFVWMLYDIAEHFDWPREGHIHCSRSIAGHDCDAVINRADEKPLLGQDPGRSHLALGRALYLPCHRSLA